MMAAYHFERALFVVGEPNSGKSNQLRSMFRDIRLGTDGNIPRERKLPDFYRLSNERCLYLRLTSPHEAKESLGRKHGRNSPTNFLEKTAKKIEENTPRWGRRWNFAGALQPFSRNHMPGVVATCHAFVRRFNPERTRIVFLSPDRHCTCLQESEHVELVDGLRRIESVEVCWIDARERTVNGLLLADFFDFT
jgi:hypothetical protein